jgi:VCBS repeat-containing protein
MRSIRLAVLVAPTLLAALLLVPSALAQTPVSFTGPTNFTAGDGPVSVAVGDFNGDGKPDLAVANELSLFPSNVSVLLGSATGSFGGPTNFPVGDFTFPFSVAVGDFNGDGKPDLVVANEFSNNVSVLLGNGTGGFTGPTNFTAGSGPASVAVGDFNGDGKPDLAVANVNDDNVSVLLNSTNQAPTAADDAYSTAEDTTLTVAAPGVLGNDSDPDGDTLSAVVGSGPSHGSLTLNPDGSFAYTPAVNFSGSDSFTYRASDGSLESSLATVTITVTAVNDAPTVTVAAGGTCGTDDRSGTINLTVGDVESAATVLTLSAASSNPLLVPNGNVVFAGSGATRTLTARAVAGRTGTATVTVTVSDGQATGSVQVTVRVGSNGNDTLIGGAATNLILGQNGNDTLTGGGVYDLLCGGTGNDILSGGGGDDSLGGGNGNDRLTGGPGADRFSGGSGTDTATDFAAAEGDTSDGTIP